MKYKQRLYRFKTLKYSNKMNTEYDFQHIGISCLKIKILHLNVGLTPL